MMETDCILNVEQNHTISLNCNGAKEIYSLNEVPHASSALVVKEKQYMLRKMDLDTALKNLNTVAGLLSVANHTLYGFDAWTQIMNLQKSLMDLNKNGMSVIGEFNLQFSAVIYELISLFSWLTKGAESVAIKKLERFHVLAGTMSRQADELAKEYHKVAGDASETLNKIISEFKRYQIENKLQKEISDFQNRQNAADNVYMEIKKQLIETQEECEKLRKTELNLKKQSCDMQIMGSLLSYLGSATITSLKQINKSFTSMPENNSTEVECGKMKYEREIVLMKFRLSDDAKTEKQIDDKQKGQLIKINRLYIRLKEEQDRYTEFIKNYLTDLKSSVNENNIIDVAVPSLMIVSSLLHSIGNMFDDISLFWKSAESLYMDVSLNLKGVIDSLQKIEKEIRVEFYFTDSVMIPLLTFMTQWVALKSISTDFIEGTEKLRFCLNEAVIGNDRAYMDRNDHWNKAMHDLTDVIKMLSCQTEKNNKK